MKREEIIDICQITRTRWMLHEAQGKLPLANKEEYTAEEALEVIKYWRYCKQVKAWSTDLSKRQLAKFLSISEAVLHKHIEAGTIPKPDKHVGLKHVYSHDLANRIKTTFVKGTTPWQRANEAGLYSLTDVCRMLGWSMGKLKYQVSVGNISPPNRLFEGRRFYSRRDFRDIRRVLGLKQNDEIQNQNPAA